VAAFYCGERRGTDFQWEEQQTGGRKVSHEHPGTSDATSPRAVVGVLIVAFGLPTGGQLGRIEVGNLIRSGRLR
jgi:hypothetical protein